MKLIESSKFRLPLVYLIKDKSELQSIPMGIPFIISDEKYYDDYVRLLEFEVLLKSALRTGLPFNWRNILKQHGYTNLTEGFASSEKYVYFYDEFELGDDGDIDLSPYQKNVGDFIADISYQVNTEVLQDLKVIPSWFVENIEEAIKINILNSVTWQFGMYNKKTDDATGAISLSTPNRNLLILDISGSIPKSIAKSLLLLSKTLSHQFYADLIITGAKSGLFDYYQVADLDVNNVYNEYGQNNESKEFREIMKQHRTYDNAIVFGDNHTPLDNWQGAKKITLEQGRKMCNFKVNKIFSFHTTSNNILAGYADMLNCDNVEHIKDWVTDLRDNNND